MAISISIINSSLKPSPPPITSPSKSNPSSSLDSLPIQAPSSAWRRRCFTGMAACLIVGSTAGIRVEESGILAEAAVVQISEGGQVMRWSDRRACPQWHPNSLEGIVPENLPRPSARRRFESVSINPTAPAPRFSAHEKAISSGSCFSL